MYYVAEVIDISDSDSSTLHCTKCSQRYPEYNHTWAWLYNEKLYQQYSTVCESCISIMDITVISDERWVFTSYKRHNDIIRLVIWSTAQLCNLCAGYSHVNLVKL